MKRIFFTSLIMFAVVTAKAQDNVKADVVTLNVKLHPIQTLVVNQSQKEVNLDYRTEADYANGVSSTVLADHLTVYSTGGFKVTVRSSDTHLITDASANPTHGQIEAGTITITASEGTITNTTATPVSLSKIDQTLIASNHGAVEKTINVQYEGKGADAYINNYIATQNPTVYSTELTYTITAQ